MYQIKVNGKMYESEKDTVLLDFLRDELHLTGTKDGCSEGACGACTVIIDGRKTKICVGKLSKYEGKTVVTIEGLSQYEKDVYVYAFGEAGAVQCGFCIPGMVMSAKSLLDENLNPTPDEVKAAIHGNICRCTGYVKIEEAIMLAAKLFREDLPIPKKIEAAGIGKRVHRVDAKEKVLGTGQYVDDVVVAGMIYAKALRTKYPRARVEKIDISKAKAHPDCVEVLLAEDVPYNKTGHIVPDWDVLIPKGDITRYIGDALALVATRHKETLDEVLSLIEVAYTELVPMLSPEEALKPDAPKIHEKGNILDVEEVNRGNVDAAIANSKYVVTRHYSTPQTDHAFMEPECAIAIPEGDDHYMLLTGSQGIYDEQHEVSRMLKLPAENIRSQSKLVGGGFGGKEDMSVQHHAALMAWKTGKPVKVQFSRQESLNIHVKRHAMEMDITTACDEEGNLTASKVVIVSDCGAYASLGGPVLQRACTHSGGPYHYDNFAVKGTCVYTNNVPGGAFRGFGVTQSAFAQEVNIDLLAEMAGMDPWAFRYKNAIRSGESLPNGQIAGDETAMVECLEAVKDAYYSSPRTGLGVCMKNSGIGVGLPDIGRMKLVVIDGIVHIRTSAACIGQGIGTVVLQILCETTGLKYDQVFVEAPDTLLTPDSGTTTASRQTLFTGEATRLAGLKLNEALKEDSLEELNGQEFYAEYFGQTDPMGSDKPHPVSHIAYGYAAGVAKIGDDMKISKFTAAYDVGQIINPQACEGQGEGGILMGMGFAVTEDFIMDKGYVKSKYGTLGLLRAKQRPELQVKLVEKANKQGLAYGAKGVGEISSIPAAPAIANAYRRIDGEERLSLPIQHTAYKK
ncbi:selenium-dependent xanthine dehydrogenase [Acetobacterium tundrae]|uniref:Selenium-dependent xanthine dehydrogenase n=1 Tax=Acetobacterium tundrae TaxID=132932 RepID=A0ABR6WGM5_9FIRM|nr:selenium-dependent xanthine dehydrogenase [Acetobacterium tundrae]MBC3795639.1 selenium-dependent xanthine dehydrogenase [Acetobacterium tundrae]